MPTVLTLDLLRLLSEAYFQSGSALAQRLCVARGSVAAALSGLDALGVKLLRERGRGYRLAAPIDWLDVRQLDSHLGEQAAQFQIELLDITESTNTTLVERAAAGAPSGCVIAAELQTAGRGRRGRAWHTGIGGALTFSVLWRFEYGAGVLAGLGPAVGVALVRALRNLGVGQAVLKWPNDVLISHHKVAGTLIEIQGDVLGPSCAVIGIGVNHRLDASTRQRIDQAVTDLTSIGVRAGRNAALGEMLAQLAKMLGQFSAHGFAPFRAEWDSYHLYAARRVALRMPDGSSELGIAAGIAEDGALLLQTSSGLRRFHSGEVSLRPVDEPRTAAGG